MPNTLRRSEEEHAKWRAGQEELRKKMMKLPLPRLKHSGAIFRAMTRL
ncbi:MAG: hypothetical protein IKP67_08580 [Spirochaetales bacterium]|nr:hypothetical protein [Spirochaetales bacterium]